MKGYSTAYGYMGYVDGEYRLFACESDYLEYMEDERRDAAAWIRWCLWEGLSYKMEFTVRKAENEDINCLKMKAMLYLNQKCGELKLEGDASLDKNRWKFASKLLSFYMYCIIIQIEK